MIQSVVGIYDGTEYVKGIPKVYTNGRWLPCATRVHDGFEWRRCGGSGTLYLYLTDSDGKLIKDSNDKYILVRMD